MRPVRLRFCDSRSPCPCPCHVLLGYQGRVKRSSVSCFVLFEKMAAITRAHPESLSEAELGAIVMQRSAMLSPRNPTRSSLERDYQHMRTSADGARTATIHKAASAVSRIFRFHSDEIADSHTSLTLFPSAFRCSGNPMFRLPPELLIPVFCVNDLNIILQACCTWLVGVGAGAISPYASLQSYTPPTTWR